MGQGFVDSIGQTLTDSADRPLATQKVNSVRIVRVGPDALDFNVHAVSPPLPVVRSISAKIRPGDTGLELVWEAKEEHDYHAFFGENLLQWNVQTLRPTGSVSLENFEQEFSNHFFFFIEAEHD